MFFSSRNCTKMLVHYCRFHIFLLDRHTQMTQHLCISARCYTYVQSRQPIIHHQVMIIVLFRQQIRVRIFLVNTLDCDERALKRNLFRCVSKPESQEYIGILLYLLYVFVLRNRSRKRPEKNGSFPLSNCRAKLNCFARTHVAVWIQMTI